MKYIIYNKYNKIQNIGFTLIELLVVIAIIGVLSTLAMAGFSYARERAKTAKAEHEIAQIYNAINMMVTDTEEWPNHQSVDTICTGCADNELCGPDASSDNCAAGGLDDDVAGLTQDDSAPNQYSDWAGPYMQHIPLDPWGYEYFFDTDYQITVDGEPCNGGGGCIDAVVIGSYGPDGEGLNSYNGDDIIKVIVR